MNARIDMSDLLKTRLLVAAIGERLPDPWWRSQFLTPTGLRVGSRVFPRRLIAAALASTTAAASRDHDVHTGRRSFHLFRLPARVEHELVNIVDVFADWEVSESLEELISLLSGMSEGHPRSAAFGPKSLGRIDQISDRTPAMFAFLYSEAAKKGKRVYPYFEAVSDE